MKFLKSILPTVVLLANVTQPATAGAFSFRPDKWAQEITLEKIEEKWHTSLSKSALKKVAHLGVVEPKKYHHLLSNVQKVVNYYCGYRIENLQEDPFISYANVLEKFERTIEENGRNINALYSASISIGVYIGYETCR